MLTVEGRIAVDDAPPVHPQIHAAVDSRIGLDQRRSTVLMPVVVHTHPRLSVVVRAIDGHGIARRRFSIEEHPVLMRPWRRRAHTDRVRVRRIRDLRPCCAAIGGVEKTITAQRQPQVSGLCEVSIDGAATRTVAATHRWQRGRIHLREDGRVVGGVHGAAVEVGAGSIAGVGVERLRCHLIGIDNGSVRNALSRSPRIAVIQRELHRVVGGAPHDGCPAGIHGDDSAVIRVIASRGAGGKRRPVCSVVGGIRAEVARCRRVTGRSLHPHDEVRILTRPVHIAHAGRYGIREHARLRRNFEVDVAKSADIADAAQQMRAGRWTNQRKHRGFLNPFGLHGPGG